MAIRNSDTRTLINFSASFQQLREHIAELFLTQPDFDNAVDIFWDSNLPFPKNRIQNEIIDLQKNLLIPIEKLFTAASEQQADLSQLLAQLTQKQASSPSPEIYRSAISEVTTELKEVAAELIKLNEAKLKLEAARQQLADLTAEQIIPWKQLLEEVTVDFFDLLSKKLNLNISNDDPRKQVLTKEVRKLSPTEITTIIQQLFTIDI